MLKTPAALRGGCRAKADVRYAEVDARYAEADVRHAEVTTTGAHFVVWHSEVA